MTVLRSGAASDVGRVRRNNQDHYLDDEPLFAVADGMGGAAGGEEASQTAVAALKATFEAHPTADGLADAVRNANRAVWEKARSRPDLRGMGTTMTAVALVEEDGDEVLAIVNVGDSRVYLLRDGVLEQLTEDHSVPEELRRAGRLTPEEAAHHPQRNVLTRALGIDLDVEVDCNRVTPYRGDRLLLASDGLFNEVDHDGIASVARRQRDPDKAAAELVKLACEGGGNDNVTVVVVDVVDDGDRAARASAAVVASSTSTRSRETAGGGYTPAHASAPEQSPLRPPASFTGGTDVTGTLRAPPMVGAGGPERRITLRVVVFFVALLLVLSSAFAAVGFFARAGYYVGLDADEVVIFKGRPGGLLWFKPTVEERTGVKVGELLPSRAPDLEDGKEESSIEEAEQYVENLKAEAAPTTTTTTTTVPPAPVPPDPAATTVPPAPGAGAP